MINERCFRLKENGELRANCYCRSPELIENYDKAMADTTQIWHCHHRKEEFYSYKELVERDEYFDVSPEDLIFLTPTEHHKIDSRCKRLSKGQKGRSAWNKGKTLSKEYKRKMSEAHKGKLAPNKGKHWKLVDGKRVYY